MPANENILYHYTDFAALDGMLCSIAERMVYEHKRC